MRIVCRRQSSDTAESSKTERREMASDPLLLRMYSHPALARSAHCFQLESIRRVCPNVVDIRTEYCFYIEQGGAGRIEVELLKWILRQPQHDAPAPTSWLDAAAAVIEIGPRLNVSTPFSTNAVSVCRSVGLDVGRLERSIRYQLLTDAPLNAADETRLVQLLCDRMTQERYVEPPVSLSGVHDVQRWYDVCIDEDPSALDKINADLALALDADDIEFYLHFFRRRLRRNPTSVECFDLAQSNSEHSRHWFFKGHLVVDGRPLAQSLLDMICATQATSGANSVVKFSDNSSAIEGYATHFLTVAA